jgi:hypothetical protein
LVSSTGSPAASLTQAGDFEIGAYNGATSPFPGKIAQAAVYSAVISAANIVATINQGLAGTETSLISAYSFNNSITDLNTTNANNLTANGSAVATNVDSPFAGGANAATGYTAGTTEYAEVFNASFSTNTTLVLQVPDGYAIPTSGGVSAVSYSTQAKPYGWPGLDSTLATSRLMANQVVTSSAADIDILGLAVTLYVPAGRQVKFTTYGAFDCASSATLHRLKVKEGSTVIGDTEAQEQTASIRRNMTTITTTYPTAGSHTYKATYNNNQVGASNLYAATDNISYLMAELVPTA